MKPLEANFEHPCEDVEVLELEFSHTHLLAIHLHYHFLLDLQMNLHPSTWKLQTLKEPDPDIQTGQMAQMVRFGGEITGQEKAA